MSVDLERLREQLRRDEGEKLHAYQDHLGYWTIGVGRLIDPRKGGRITKAESDMLLSNDIAEKHAEVDRALPWFRDLCDARQGVLLNMAFQLGTAGLLKFERTLEAIRAGDYETAAQFMLQSLWAKQTPARAQRLAEQMRTGQWA